MKHLYTILFITVVFLQIVEGQKIIDDRAVEVCEITNMKDINTPEFEFSPAFYGDGIAFVYSLKQEKSLFDRNINTSFFDLGFYFPDYSEIPFDSVQNLSMYRFDKELNSEYHEGPCSFFEDVTCYFTREDATYKNAKKRKKKRTALQILKSENVHNIWSKSEVLSFCEKEYSYCHPTISKDGKSMIFASDKPGGYGKMDLYFTQLNDLGEWSEPYNLGNHINSTANDWFPHSFKDNTLFFASDKNGGLGGLDVYVSLFDGTNWSDPERLPRPINSSKDDFGLILMDNGKIGYFSSSRPGGKGNDDIYQFKIPESIMFQDNNIEFMFSLMDTVNNIPLAGVQMEYVAIKTEDRVFDIKDYDVNLLKSKSEGHFLLELSPINGMKNEVIKSNDFGKLWGSLNRKSPYILTFSKEGFDDYTIVFDPNKTTPTMVLVMNEKIEQPQKIDKITTNISRAEEIYIPTTSGAKVTFNNIHYGSGEFLIMAGAAKELNALIKVMRENMEMKIILNSHTDAIGNESYNLILSQKRADEAKNYLVRHGVSEDRVIAIGIGEAEISNHCKNGIDCSTEEHKVNRRTEVEVL